MLYLATAATVKHETAGNEQQNSGALPRKSPSRREALLQQIQMQTATVFNL